MLSNDEYVKLLDFYKIQIPDSKKQLKIEAEKILAEKLCKCIKKVDPINEICRRNFLNKKGLTRGRFKCNTFRKNKTKKKQTKY
jgi:hypothetical protein